MYLFHFDQKQKETFLSLALALIESNGIIDKEEITQIHLMKNEMQIKSDYEIKRLDNLDSIVDVFHSSKSKMICLMELIGLSYIDGAFCQKEKDFIEIICNKLSIPLEKIEIADEWVNRILSETSKGYEIINS